MISSENCSNWDGSMFSMPGGREGGNGSRCELLLLLLLVGVEEDALLIPSRSRWIDSSTFCSVAIFLDGMV